MSPDELVAVRDDVQILDVREPYEWDAGHLPDALHIPMGDLSARQSELATDRTIVCVCRSGARSGRVVEALRGAGLTAENLDGGMKAWDASGLPFEDRDGDPGTVA